MSQNRQATSGHDDAYGFLLIPAALVIICWLWFSKFVWVSCLLLYWLWGMVDFQRIHPWVAEKINLLARTGNHAQSISWHDWFAVMNETSGILLIFLLPIAISALVGIKNHPSRPMKSKRIVNIHTLPQIMSKWSPAIVPVLAESRSPDLLMNDDGLERRWAEKPEEFAARHGLIASRILDREKARDVFISQLGTRLSASPDTLQDYEKALFAVFGLQVLMNDRKAAKKLLDDLNRSCLPRNRKERKRTKNLYRPDFSRAEKAFLTVWQAEGMKEIHATHQYVRTALSGLLGHDIRLPPSQYLWLKPIDRTLWYALHGADTASVFVEGAGVIAQTRFEIVVRKEKLPLQIDYVESAIDGLQYELEGLGLVHERRVKKTERRKKAPDWLPPTLSQDSFTDLQGDEPEPAEAEQPEDNAAAAEAHPDQDAGRHTGPSTPPLTDTASAAVSTVTTPHVSHDAAACEATDDDEPAFI